VIPVSVVELLVGLLAALALLVLLARHLNLPYPILLVVGGLALGFLPGVPRVELAPNLVFLLFLPPILYEEAYFTSWRDFRANLRPISLLVFGLVLATTAAVAAVAHWAIPGLAWQTAFVLGAVVAPTDEIAVVPTVHRLKVPRRVTTIIEGESLVNDAVSLVIYRLAVAAVVSGAFSLAQAGVQLVLISLGGVAIGLASGWLVSQIVHRINDPPVEITLSLAVPYAGYLPAEKLGASGVLAVVTMGIYLGRKGSLLFAPQTRLQAGAFWSMLVFLLNGFLFILVGMQFPRLLSTLSHVSIWVLIGEALLISAACILVRLVWLFPTTYLPRFLSRRLRERDPYPPWQWPVIVGWAGIRGALSLAAALAIPLTVRSGAPFPERDRIIFLTFGVILVTLVLQGLTLPVLIRRLGVEDDGSAEREENEARLRAAEAGLDRLEAIAAEQRAPQELIDDLRRHYIHRLRRLRARSDGSFDGRHEEQLQQSRQLQRELLDAEHTTVIELRDQGVINDQVLHEIERDLDLERVRRARDLERRGEASAQ
jgi:CPA1 family monovalent cation:H+ antiporter